jgi:flagellar hook-basal body complex protein FliE
MSDPIGLARAARALDSAGSAGKSIASLLDQAGAIGGTDNAKHYTIDLGKGGAEGSSFGDLLTKAINQVSDSQDRATDYVQQFMRGEPVELHQVMAAAEEANISLEIMVELRNKFTDAYRSLIGMQS